MYSYCSLLSSVTAHLHSQFLLCVVFCHVLLLLSLLLLPLRML
jgi:hypothetical protein